MSAAVGTNKKLCVALLEYRLFGRHYSRPKLSAVIEKNVQEAIEEKKFKPKHHPGILKLGPVGVPRDVQKAIQVVLQDQPVKAVLKEGVKLVRFLKGRHPPPEDHEVRAKKAQLEEMVCEELGVDLSSLEDEQRKHVQNQRDQLVLKKLRQHVHTWHSVHYDSRYKALLYALARAPADYAVLVKILGEIKHRHPHFSPATMFDFGSGVGTATWAVRKLWQDAPKEYFCVDSSSEMNDFASLLLRDGNENKEMALKGVFYRQFLPAANVRPYDLVICAYSLLELPSSQTRLETILNLWKKTQGFLVLVEQGTNAGFKVINEARDFLLNLSSSDARSNLSAHVVAPCPHDLQCPRFFYPTIPCNFEVSYTTLPFGQRPYISREKYCYVVMKRGERRSEDPQWPRLVSPTLLRHKHAVCRMCCANGQLQEVVFTAAKHGKIPYRCARASKWGDLLPMRIEPSDNVSQLEDSEMRPEEEEQTDQPP